MHLSPAHAAIDASEVEGRLSIAVNARVKITLMENLTQTSMRLTLRATDYADGSLLQAAVVVPRIEAQMPLLNRGLLPFTISTAQTATQSIGLYPECAVAEPVAGQTVSALLGGHARDLDLSDTLGLAVVGQPSSSASGVFQYKRAGQSETVWTNIPAVSERSALTLGSQDSIRFMPQGQLYRLDALLMVRVWDGTAGDLFVDASLSAPTVSVSAHLVAVSVSRRGCDSVAGSGWLMNQCCQCLPETETNSSCVSPCLTQRDACGICGGNGSSCLGCDLIPFSGRMLDD